LPRNTWKNCVQTRFEEKPINPKYKYEHKYKKYSLLRGRGLCKRANITISIDQMLLASQMDSYFDHETEGTTVKYTI
jgi:hypothetical protein